MNDQEFEDQAEELAKAFKSLGNGGRDILPWPEVKLRGERLARDAAFDVERILLGGRLEEVIRAVWIDMVEMIEDVNESGVQNLLEMISGFLARELAIKYGYGDDTSELLAKATALLSLYPRLWRAADKPFTLEEIKAMDIERLLAR